LDTEYLLLQWGCCHIQAILLPSRYQTAIKHVEVSSLHSQPQQDVWGAQMGAQISDSGSVLLQNCIVTLWSNYVFEAMYWMKKL